MLALHEIHSKYVGHFFLSALLAFVLSTAAKAQYIPDAAERAALWDAFVEQYLSPGLEDEENAYRREADYERMEQWRDHPINLNTADKTLLLELPFLTESEADSILAYRNRYRLFYSTGELQLVHGLREETRRWMRLFTLTPTDETTRYTRKKQKRQWTGNALWRTDIPFYEREGQKGENPRYLGNGLAHTLRLRLEYGQTASMGLTGQKDAGEPFCSRGKKPFDHLSGFFLLSGKRKGGTLLLGDYDLYAAQGLVLGKTSFGGKAQRMERLPAGTGRLKPHTSTTECGYFRGVAGEKTWEHFRLITFLSLQQIDARRQGDTITTLYTDGLHRTISEREHRNAASLFTGGARGEWRTPDFVMGITALTDRYSRTVFPDIKPYNLYYMRGKTATGFSADYTTRGRKWSLTGEAAFDKKLHPATSHTLRFSPFTTTTFTLQMRHFSPQYVAIHAEADGQSSRTQNETGLLLGVQTRLTENIEALAYADLYLFHRPTYRCASACSKGSEVYADLKWYTGKTSWWNFRYKIRTRQQNITGHKGYVEYVTSHRGRCAFTLTPSPKWSVNMAADASLSTSPTRKTETGWMVSLRSTYKPVSRFSTSVFASAFFTDSYKTRLFAYQPQLRHSSSFPSFYYHGMSAVALAEGELCKGLRLAARYVFCKYFNRPTISSGTQQIDSSVKNDLSLQLYWTF